MNICLSTCFWKKLYFQLFEIPDIALFEKYTLPKLKCEAKKLSEALNSYKKGDNESYTKLRNIISAISKL